MRDAQQTPPAHRGRPYRPGPGGAM